MNKESITKKNIIFLLITAIICIYVSSMIATAYFPQPQFTIDLTDYATNGVTIYTYHNEGTPFVMNTQDSET